jgi:hypothetical protein
MANPWIDLSTDQLIDRIGDPGSRDSHAVEMHLLLRQTKAQIWATRYMFWSVVAITITSGLNAFFAFLIWYAPRH